MEQVLTYLQYFGLCLWYTLGAVALCGLAAHLSRRAFVSLAGNGIFVYITSLLGTPVHELGHAIPCPLFGHKITEMKLLLPPRHPSGTLGYVEHSYNKRNPWARLGNLFIGVGPIFSCLGVILLCLCLCFPNAWEAYLADTSALSASTALPTLLTAALSLLTSLPAAFETAEWWIPAVGLVVILFVSQHATLSVADVKGALSALPIYLLLLFLVTLPTHLCGVGDAVLDALFHFHLWTLSFFAVSIAFSLLWVVLGLVIFVLRSIKNAF